MTTTPFFFNQCLDKGRLKRMILWSLTYQGEYKTIQIIENLKTLGFKYATHAGVSLSIDDLSVPPKKRDEVLEAETFVTRSIHGGYRGNRTAIEELQSVIDTWHRTSENVKQHVIDYFEATNILNPVYMMAFSGARGNVSQVRQLVGMRGLMADPKGDIIGFPIRSNFREGLTITEYMISCYGARKGVVDTALRTADAGYLTRRLVDVAQHVVVKQGSCGTQRGITIAALQSYGKTVLKLADRLVGRVLAADFVYEGRVIARRNDPISEVLADQLAALRKHTLGQSAPRLLVRSPLTCELRSGVCQLCYGWSLSQNAMVTIGEAVGIIAGQSIGEPGTQLTMRTFHTGGVFTGDVDEQFRSPHGGRVTYPTPFPGKLIRTSYGQIAFLVKAPGCMYITDETRNIQTQIRVPMHTALFTREGQYVRDNELIGQFDGVGSQQNERIRTNKIVFSEMSGQVTFENTRFTEARVMKKHVTANRWKHRTSGGLGTLFILAGDRLGGTHELLPLYKSSGALLAPQTPLIQTAVRGAHDGFICLVPESGRDASALSHSARLMPPLATYRMTPSQQVRPQRPVHHRKAIYIPLFTGQYQRIPMGIDIPYTRIVTSTGDCVDFGNKQFTKTIWNFHGQAPQSTDTQAVQSAVGTRARLLFTYLPVSFKTDIGGSFWSVDAFVDSSRRYGLLAFTSRAVMAGFTGARWGRRRLSWKASARAGMIRSNGHTVGRPQSSCWLVSGHTLEHSLTLQAQPRSSVSACYGLIQSTHSVHVLPPIVSHPIKVRQNPNLVQNPLRAATLSYDLDTVVTALKPAAFLHQFPFSVVPQTSTSARRLQVYPSWLYFPKPGVGGLRPDVSPGAFELPTPIQSFVPALINGHTTVQYSSGRERTHDLLGKITLDRDLKALVLVRYESVLFLKSLRQAFSLRHPELLQFMHSGSMRVHLLDAYHVARNLHIFTHVISPWVSCVQPSSYILSAPATFHRLEHFLGWVYKPVRLGPDFTPLAYYQERSLRHVNFLRLVTATMVIAHTSISLLPMDRIQTIRRRLLVGHSLEGAQMQDQTWSARPAIWVKQASSRDSTAAPNPNVRHLLCLPPLRRWLRTPTYALRIKSQIMFRDGFTAPKLLFTNPVKLTSRLSRAWSAGVFTIPPRRDALLAAPHTLHLAQDPIRARSRYVKDAGETFVVNNTDVIMLRARHIVAFSFQQPLDASCNATVGQLVRYGDEIVPGLAVPVSGQILAVTPSQIMIRRGQPVLFYKAASIHVANCQWIRSGHPLVTLAYQRLITGDIVQGIPKVEQVFEASRRRDATLNVHRFVAKSFKLLRLQKVPAVATRQTLALVQRQIIDRIQQIYLSQGVSISDKHFEVIVRQMTSHVRILDPGKSGLFRNEVMSISRVEYINLGTIGMQKKWEPSNEPMTAQYVPVVLGISATALTSESFLSSASFQETTRVLSRDAVLTRTDFLGGLKERVILGDLIPAGTGLFETIRARNAATALRPR